ncbi:MAG: ABC transporter substrate-binding protein [Rhodospirillales bacterium]|nr:ABC transporter substrate-binding protein [Rhodospirillales bacterium]
MTGWMRWLVAVSCLAGSSAWAQAPQRVVTVNLCLDQAALRLAAPGQLVGLSYLSHDPRLSVLSDRARAIPPVRAKVESILELRPDLVIFDRDAHANLKRLVRRAGVPILEVPWASSLEDAEGSIARIGAALGREAEGRAIIADMQEQRRRLGRPGPPTALAAVLQANRATAGKGSLMDELLHLSGYRNLAAELGVPAYGRLPLEAVLAGRPDVLVLDGNANAKPARATEFVDHNALLALAGSTRLVSIPLKYTVCAGPENVEALKLLRGAQR